jgi:hypothetical protein
MRFERVLFHVHTLQRMFERGVTYEEVTETLKTGEMIEEYSDNKLYPSRLLLGWPQERPLHVVAAVGEPDTAVIITVYEPDPDQWDDEFKRRTTA